MKITLSELKQIIRQEVRNARLLREKKLGLKETRFLNSRAGRLLRENPMISGGVQNIKNENDIDELLNMLPENITKLSIEGEESYITYDDEEQKPFLTAEIYSQPSQYLINIQSDMLDMLGYDSTIRFSKDFNRLKAILKGIIKDVTKLNGKVSYYFSDQK